MCTALNELNTVRCIRYHITEVPIRKVVVHLVLFVLNTEHRVCQRVKRGMRECIFLDNFSTLNSHLYSFRKCLFLLSCGGLYPKNHLGALISSINELTQQNGFPFSHRKIRKACRIWLGVTSLLKIWTVFWKIDFTKQAYLNTPTPPLSLNYLKHPVCIITLNCYTVRVVIESWRGTE